MTSVAFHADQLFYRVPGGIGTYVRELLPALRAADPSLDLVAFHSDFGRRPPSALDGFDTVTLAGGIRRLYPSWNAMARPRLPADLSARDVLHAASPVAIPPPGRRQRLVVTVHDLAFRLFPRMYPRTWRTLFRLGLRRLSSADAVIAVSRHTARDVTRLAGVDPARVHVVPLAASLRADGGDPTPDLDRLGVPRPYVLFVGTLEPRKNLVRLVRAYRRLAERRPHALVLAGPRGWGRRPLEREVGAPGPGRIVITGHVDAGALDSLYRGAAAFAYPSWYEGFGLPVLEAMARGVPTVTAATSSLPDLVGDAALLADPRSVRQLASALERLLDDPPERARLAAAGPARAARFSWERTARMTLDVYGLVRR